MKTLILTLAAAASLTAAGGALAQPANGDIDRRVDHLQERIHQGVLSGQLNRREAWRAHAALRNISLTERRYLRDGYLNGYERADLDRRLDALSQQVRYDRHDGDGYGDRDRYGYNTYRPY